MKHRNPLFSSFECARLDDPTRRVCFEPTDDGVAILTQAYEGSGWTHAADMTAAQADQLAAWLNTRDN